MLEISEQVVSRFRELDYQAFERQLLDFVCEAVPEALEMSGREEMLREVNRVVQIALMRDFITEQQVAKFAVLHFLLGDDFDLDPDPDSIGALMRDSSLSPDERVDMALEALDPEIADIPVPAAWG